MTTYLPVIIRSILLLSVPLTAACALATPPVRNPSEALRAQAEQLQVLTKPPVGPFIKLGEFKGRGCQKKVFDINIPEADALQELKLQAAAVAADALMNTVCRALTIDWFTDCFQLIECTGEAIRFQDEKPR